ncbi:3',5'-cyclic-nucleotide phosphodiesterase [Calidifontimicrobium sp. SYSU G02091]|uniref:MBL fold metallo-hydrolase n=1 Tax=Calidifontimicrobium sp. SYSU G02091 TaxID=2926421 RepID=UPI001F53D607|nr:3',5'-cyclic-nucleotide phosphodiesterase [Calidifontimicrobium sp. SYSU G02091]MCI1190382.1 3',5'-cyclic-nucleotide phosphodiesterase [Calidifontimicrobium sp. SYSU G02091]
MTIRVLGCSGSIAAGSRTTAFLVDDDLLVDAGTGVGDLSLDELLRIDHVVVSHSHLDHVLAIGLLADTVSRRRIATGRGPIAVHALPATITALRTHVFNDVIWPDFSRLPSVEQPLLRFVPFAVGDVLCFGARRVEVLPAAHTVPAVGFAVQPREGAPAWVFSGDTGPNPALWQRLRALPVAHVVIETAFGDEDAALAAISGHLSPSSLAGELSRLAPGVDVHVTHVKPGEVDTVMRQVAALGLSHRIHTLASGQRLTLDATV